MSSNAINNNGVAPIVEDELQCSICLETITNKSHPDSCVHLFCLDCLRRWSYVSEINILN